MTRTPRILVVDDTPANLRLLQGTFELAGLSVAMAESGEEALSAATDKLPDLVLLDLRMPGIGGMETLSRFKALAAELPVIMLTSYGEVAEAVEAIKRGAEDFLVRPIQGDRLTLTVRRALERSELKAQVEHLRRLVDRQGYLARLIAPSPRMRELVEQIRQVADSNFTVLIQGETGTGKELVARAIHQESPRADKPFIAIDSGAIPDTLVESELFGHEKGAFSGADRRKEGHFQMANAGTLFLDEVSNLPLPSQPKLLRAIQERQVIMVGSSRAMPVNVRIIVATNESLHDHIDKGLFRQDLYYRLAEFVISLPPLRERREDILPLAKFFLDEASVELKRPGSLITGAAAQLLQGCPWPGNIRQLRNVNGETLSFQPYLSMNDYTGLAYALLSGAGIGDLPPLVNPELLREGRLVEVMPKWHFRTFNLSLVHLGNRYLPRPVHLFRDFAAEMAPKLVGTLPH
jgi:two-component system, NtrC family, response regulator HydG